MSRRRRAVFVSCCLCCLAQAAALHSRGPVLMLVLVLVLMLVLVFVLVANAAGGAADPVCAATAADGAHAIDGAPSRRVLGRQQ